MLLKWLATREAVSSLSGMIDGFSVQPGGPLTDTWTLHYKFLWAKEMLDR